MNVSDVLLWGALGALVCGYALNEAYDAGVASGSVLLNTVTADLGTARSNLQTLKDELEDANRKVAAYQAGGMKDEAAKSQLQQQAQGNAERGQARVEAAKTIKTSTDDVLRTYWEAQ
ncbi:hypothetical protein EGJ51_17830 [Pseudomonas fulva]|uniref:hypothetical protein n=1 Tax=Pseudomonas fulva TaxID=47880 RepID=UPI000F79EB3A|nr:hypothetical protein [Pseudomonas fulva]RRW59499.1 hypothetical protein EGJ51_17830 [Pseudomonas fulva]